MRDRTPNRALCGEEGSAEFLDRTLATKHSASRRAFFVLAFTLCIRTQRPQSSHEWLMPRNGFSGAQGGLWQRGLSRVRCSLLCLSACEYASPPQWAPHRLRSGWRRIWAGIVLPSSLLALAIITLSQCEGLDKQLARLSVGSALPHRYSACREQNGHGHAQRGPSLIKSSPESGVYINLRSVTKQQLHPRPSLLLSKHLLSSCSCS
jgi:hypothetical protein